MLGGEGVKGREGMIGGKGATGQFPNAPILVRTAVNMTYEDIGMTGVTGAKGLLGARRTHCGLLNLAQCQGLMHVSVMMLMAMLMPLVLVRRASMWMTVLSLARMRVPSSGRGGLELLWSTTRRANADVFVASKRWRLSAATLSLPWMRPRGRAKRRGPGAPATIGIRCMWDQAVAHRDHSPAPLRFIVAPFRIAMGTSLQRFGETPVRAVAVAPHNAEMGDWRGSAAGGGRQSPTASATPPERLVRR